MEPTEAQKNAPKIRKIKEMRKSIEGLIRDVEQNYNNPDMAIVRVKLREAKHWCGEHLKTLGHELPEKYRDE